VKAHETRLVTPRFALVVTCGLCYFLALAMLTPVLPHYVKGELGDNDAAVGVAVGAFAVGAVVLRTYMGRLGDRVGRRALIIFGALAVSVSTLFYGLIAALWWLILMRIVTGFGEAAFFVGAATMITDLSPPERRGEAVSYWSVAVYGGLSFGPVLGEVLRHGNHYFLTFAVSAALALTAAVLGFFTRDVTRLEGDPAKRGRLWHPAAMRPGVVLFLGLMPLSAFTPLVPLYADSDVHASVGLVFLLYGVLILLVRIFGARIPDRWGASRTGLFALVGAGAGILLVSAIPTVGGLVAGTAVFAVGMSLLYPALLLLSLVGIPDTERASVVGTFSSFFDLSTGFGAAIAGGIAELTGYRGAFAVSGLMCLSGVLVLRATPARHERVV
jgi:MFS family permease